MAVSPEELEEPFKPAVEVSSKLAGFTGGLAVDQDQRVESLLSPHEASSRFLSDERIISGPEQLAVMAEFWKSLGYELPELNEDQARQLSAVLAKDPASRVIPAPFLEYTQRLELARQARREAGSDPQIEDLIQKNTNGPRRIYDHLLQYPGIVTLDDRPHENYALLYVVSNENSEKRLMGRDQYIHTLIASGRAIQAKDGLVWAFPVMPKDLHTRYAADGETTGRLHRLVDETTTPESLMALNILYRRADWSINFHAKRRSQQEIGVANLANEAIYRIEEGGSLVMWRAVKVPILAKAAFSPDICDVDFKGLQGPTVRPVTNGLRQAA